MSASSELTWSNAAFRTALGSVCAAAATLVVVVAEGEVVDTQESGTLPFSKCPQSRATSVDSMVAWRSRMAARSERTGARAAASVRACSANDTSV